MPTLVVLMLVPLVGSLLVAFVPTESPVRAKQLALLFSAATFVVTCFAALQFDTDSSEQFQLVQHYSWIPSLGVSFSLGIDGLGLVMLFLATLLVPLVIAAGWNDVEDTAALPTSEQESGHVRGYFALVLVLEAMMIGVFTAIDVFLFYFLFEAILVPVYFMIGRYGTGRRTYAAVKFLIYSLAGGLVMLAALAVLWFASLQALGQRTMYLPDLMATDFSPALQNVMFWGFFLAFAIKAPLWPVHTWLPDAAGSATPGTAILLIGVLDKIGTYGMLRFCLTLFPEASQTFAPVVIALSVVGIFYGALAAIGQSDMKRLFAYVSVSHFGFITMGIFVFTTQAQVGSAFYMLGHGLSTALLFMVAGYLIARRRSAQIDDYRGVVNEAPVLAGLFLVAGLSALALPGMITFLSEFLVLLGTFTRYPWLGAIATLGIILAALYMLLLYQRTMTGPTLRQALRQAQDGAQGPDEGGMRDVGVREKLAVAPIIVLVIVLGFYPAPVLDVLNPYVSTTMEQVGTSDPPPEVPLASEVQP